MARIGFNAARLAALSIAAVLAIGSVDGVAQQVDFDALFKRFDERYAAGDYAAAADVSAKLEAAVRARFGTEHVNYAVALYHLGISYAAQGKYAEAENAYKRSIAIREKAKAPSHPNQARTFEGLAGLYHHIGRHAESERLFQQALAIREKTQGANHLQVAVTLKNFAYLLFTRGKHADAEQLYKRALAIQEPALGANHPDVVNTISSLGNVLYTKGSFVEAERLLNRVLAAQTKALGTEHAAIATALNDVANVYVAQGKLADAEDLFKRAIAIREKSFGASHPDVAAILGNLANVYYAQQKLTEAEALYQRALAIQAPTGDSVALANSLHNLASVYNIQGKYADAESLQKRALAMRQKLLGDSHAQVADTLNNLAFGYQEQGRMTEAEGLHRRALAIWEKALGENHPNVAQSLNNLANILYAHGKYADAAEMHKRAAAIREKVLGQSHADLAQSLANLANAYDAQGKSVEAAGLHERAIAIWTKALGENHPNVAIAIGNLAASEFRRGQVDNALSYSRKAIAAVIARDAVSGAQPQSGTFLRWRAEMFARHTSLLLVSAAKDAAREPELSREALQNAQQASLSSAAAALQQMAVRFAAGDGALAARVRDLQDRAAAREAGEKAIIASLSKPDAQRDRPGIDVMRRKIAEIETEITAATAQLERQFPDYTTLTNPKPLVPEEVQTLLAEDEALIFFLTADTESFVFALTRAGLLWSNIPTTGNELANKVAAFRRGLDVAEITGSQKPQLFDLALAHELYAALLGPVEAHIKDKRHLLVVPSGALTALPLHLLVTEKPTSTPQDFAGYRDVAWLAKRHAVSVLPSVTSLRALRVFARKDQGSEPMIGFADPVFGPEKPAAGAARATKMATTRAYTDFWRGAAVDRNRLAEALPRLEDTADEVATVAKKLAANPRDIYLRERASEAAVKQAKLSDYRVVYFATHGLVAGDVKGLAEPSLALTIPKQPSDLDDGLLTASEVAQLKLNADWVVLSACNTIAGEKPGAEALSGLARAFFYAGARALLVSHWAVDSAAATQLTTATFDILKADPRLGRAEALRRAMLDYMNDTSDPKHAYPAYWAPFALVGEGAAR